MKKIVVFVIIFLIFINVGCLSLKEAYIPYDILKDGWYEDVGSEESGSGFFGISKWSTKVYRKGEVSFLSVTSLKFLILQSKESLIDDVEEDIRKQSDKYGIDILEESKVTGSREIAKGHKTIYIIYDGKKEEHDYKIIGEVWSCSESGISVICMGFSDVSDVDGIEGWREIIGDPYGSIDGIVYDGLIYNVVCH